MTDVHKVGPFMGQPGMFTGLYDRMGQPIHIGDTVRFDPKEWGNDETNVFVVRFEKGELQVNGTPFDMHQWCEVIQPAQQASTFPPPLYLRMGGRLWQMSS